MSRRRVLVWAALSVALLASAAAVSFAAVRGPEPPRTSDERVHAVARTLRCPVCQNLSVADSPSPLAQQMRRTIARKLDAGETPEEIRREFVAAYGEWILQAPPKEGLGLVAWIAPGVLLVAGMAAAVVALRRWTAGGPGARTGSPPTLSREDRRLLDRALAAEEPR